VNSSNEENFTPGELDMANGTIWYTGSIFDASMANPHFVEGMVRFMVTQVTSARCALEGAAEAEIALDALLENWTTFFSASNHLVEQRMSPDLQAQWLISQGYGGQNSPSERPVKVLMRRTAERALAAAFPYEDISSDQADFWMETAVEDCVATLLGFRNSAD
jgi:hypothetical protein